MYFGMILFLLGGSIILSSASTFFVPFVFAYLINERFIRKEEEMLAEKFGEVYIDYKKNVRRWI